MRLTPSLISMTSSVGTRIWPNLPSSPARLMRSVRAFLTLFSYCEYAWTTYHCIVAAAVSVIGSASASDTFHSPEQQRIQAPQQQRRDQHDDRDHQRRLQAFLARRPGGLAQLDLRAADVIPHGLAGGGLVRERGGDTEAAEHDQHAH